MIRARNHTPRHVWLPALVLMVSTVLLLATAAPLSAQTPEPPDASSTAGATPTPEVIPPSPETIAFFHRVRGYPLPLALLENRGVALSLAMSVALLLAAAGVAAMPSRLWLYAMGLAPRPAATSHAEEVEELAGEIGLAELAGAAVPPAPRAVQPQAAPHDAGNPPAGADGSQGGVPQQGMHAPPAQAGSPQPTPQPTAALDSQNRKAQPAPAGSPQPTPQPTAAPDSQNRKAQPAPAQGEQHPAEQAAQQAGPAQATAPVQQPAAQGAQAPASQQPAQEGQTAAQQPSGEGKTNQSSEQAGSQPAQAPQQQAEPSAQALLGDQESETQQGGADDVKDILKSAFEEEEEVDPQLHFLASRLEDVEAKSLVLLAQEVLRLFWPTYGDQSRN